MAQESAKAQLALALEQMNLSGHGSRRAGSSHSGGGGDGDTEPLYMAAVMGQADAIKFLVERGADVQVRHCGRLWGLCLDGDGALVWLGCSVGTRAVWSHLRTKP
jgi:hypothetical protein